MIFAVLLTFSGGGGRGRCPFGFDLLAAAADDVMQVTVRIHTFSNTRAHAQHKRRHRFSPLDTVLILNRTYETGYSRYRAASHNMCESAWNM